MQKVKLVDVIGIVSEEAVLEAIKTVKPKYKEMSKEELAETFGFTDFQFEHLVTKALGRSVSEKVEAKISEILDAGGSIEVPHQFQVFVHESQARLNENGKPARKLSIRTRKAKKESLNNY